MIKYPKTPRLKSVLEDDKLLKSWRKHHTVISEKLDGANAGISFSPEGLLMLQSRGHVLTGGHRERQFELFKQWGHGNLQALYGALGDRYVLFGEWLYAKHKIFYDALPGYFVEYDVYDKEKEHFMSTERRAQLIGQLGIPPAPILHQGTFGKINSFAKYIGDSAFKTVEWKRHLESLEGTDDSTLMEGIYIKVEDEEKVVGRIKFPRPEFEKIRDDNTDWLRRPIIKNLLQG